MYHGLSARSHETFTIKSDDGREFTFAAAPKATLQLQLPIGLLEWLRKQAIEKDVSLANIVREYLAAGIEKLGGIDADA